VRLHLWAFYTDMRKMNETETETTDQAAQHGAARPRTVRTCLDRLAAGGIVSPGDPDIVAARIKRADAARAAGT
jgi:hypothetical protein